MKKKEEAERIRQTQPTQQVHLVPDINYAQCSRVAVYELSRMPLGVSRYSAKDWTWHQGKIIPTYIQVSERYVAERRSIEDIQVVLCKYM